MVIILLLLYVIISVCAAFKGVSQRNDRTSGVCNSWIHCVELLYAFQQDFYHVYIYIYIKLMWKKNHERSSKCFVLVLFTNT